MRCAEHGACGIEELDAFFRIHDGRAACAGLAAEFRLRRDLAEQYATHARRVEDELNLAAVAFDRRGGAAAVETFRAERGIDTPLDRIDWDGVCWRKREPCAIAVQAPRISAACLSVLRKRGPPSQLF